jgi:signal transduction histidine kinase
MSDEQRELPQEIILIVDDNHNNLRFLAEILFERGYDIRTVSRGSRALWSVQVEQPDLILLDIKMPDMSGYEVCEKLKADEQTRDIPVIFISALQEVSEKVKGLSLGGVDYITKPFQVEEVLARVHTHLTLRRLQKKLQENNVQLQQEITERQRAEGELMNYKEDLEKLVEQRTIELQKSNAQLQEKNLELQRSKEALQQAKEAAEVAHRAKGEFIANISHELRTPLHGVLGYAQILEQQTGFTEQHQKTIEKILQSGRHLLVIIEDLIALSKIEAGKLEMQVEEFYLPSFLKSIAKIFDIRAKEQGISFEYNVAPDLPTIVYGDERRLRQILLNLLGNAVKFTREGKVIFRVKRSAIDKVNNRQLTIDGQQLIISKVRFEVEDSGVGIPPDQLEDIFSAFHQVGEKRLAQTQGIGLGLTVSQRLASMMDSELHVQSTLGEGSTFWFDLDLAEVVGQKPIPPKEEPEEEVREIPELEEKPPLVSPPHEEVEQLLDLAVMGDIMAIRERAKALETSEKKFAAFAEKLSQLAEELQITEIQLFLQQFLEEAQ